MGSQFFVWDFRLRFFGGGSGWPIRLRVRQVSAPFRDFGIFPRTPRFFLCFFKNSLWPTGLQLPGGNPMVFSGHSGGFFSKAQNNRPGEQPRRPQDRSGPCYLERVFFCCGFIPHFSRLPGKFFLAKKEKKGGRGGYLGPTFSPFTRGPFSRRLLVFSNPISGSWGPTDLFFPAFLGERPSGGARFSRKPKPNFGSSLVTVVSYVGIKTNTMGGPRNLRQTRLKKVSFALIGFYGRGISSGPGRHRFRSHNWHFRRGPILVQRGGKSPVHWFVVRKKSGAFSSTFDSQGSVPRPKPDPCWEGGFFGFFGGLADSLWVLWFYRCFFGNFRRGGPLAEGRAPKGGVPKRGRKQQPPWRHRVPHGGEKTAGATVGGPRRGVFPSRGGSRTQFKSCVGRQTKVGLGHRPRENYSPGRGGGECGGGSNAGGVLSHR